MMEHTIITISREFCTGGLNVAKKVADGLGIPMYDKELITMAAQQSGLSEEAIAASEKCHTGSLLYGLYTMGADLPLGDQVYIIQSRVIRQLAERGPCVIVGRCGDYVLRDDPKMLSVFLHAPMEFRKRWGRQSGQLPREMDDHEIEILIGKEDKRRASYYNYYTEYRWGSPDHHDLSLNAAMGEDVCADLILRAAKG